MKLNLSSRYIIRMKVLQGSFCRVVRFAAMSVRLPEDPLARFKFHARAEAIANVLLNLRPLYAPSAEATQ
jgi:hypothetical protein